MVTAEDIIDWIQLFSTKNIGIKNFWSLMNVYGTASEALKHVKLPSDRREAEKIYKKAQGNILITIDDKYPKHLKDHGFPPPILYYSGNCEFLNENLISIVGARNASLTGRNIAERFAKNLREYFPIASGMARGIDTYALTTATNAGKAVAVLPFGLDNIYPQENAKLFDKVCTNGVAVTEVPPGRHPDQGMFFARNKLLVSMSRGIIVIEAALKSGTMNTAELALDMGCEVMVVPGSPLDARSFGSNLLIKNGANLVQTAQDVLEIISPTVIEQKQIFQPVAHKSSSNDISNIPEYILTQLSSIPVSIDVLANVTNTEISELLAIVSQLELAGKIAKTYNNEIVLV